MDIYGIQFSLNSVINLIWNINLSFDDTTISILTQQCTMVSENHNAIWYDIERLKLVHYNQGQNNRDKLVNHQIMWARRGTREGIT